MHDLILMKDIAKQAGISLSRAYVLAMDKRAFPPVFHRIGNVNLFHPDDVDHWVANRVDGRKVRRKQKRKR